jgi:quinol monooxygenase YgiN
MNALRGLPFATMILAAVMVSPALAQVPTNSPTNSPAVVVTYIEVASSAESETANLLRQFAAVSRSEAGNLRYEVLQQFERTDHFAILEAWTDAKAFESHAATAGFKAFRDKLKPHQVAPYDERPSVALSLGPIAAAGSAGAVYVVTHVDVAGNFKDETIVMLQKLADDSRKSADRFEVWQQGNRANHFTVNEIWKSEGALDEHIASAPIRAFREALGPKNGALYDDRRYLNLETK